MTDPWLDDARRLFQLIQTEGMAVLRRAGPDVLDRVAELAGSLAVTLREMDADRDPQPVPPPERSTDHEMVADAPTTVRIDVTD